MINKIIFDNVSLSFELECIFKNFSIELHAGKVIAITGSNGAGKSTFLKLAGQFIQPDSGTVTAFSDETKIDRIDFRQRIAVIAPSMNLYEHMTALENFNFFIKLRNILLNDEDIDKIFSRVGFDTYCKNRFISKFSTGMKQRLKFAIMLAINADVWILDEPCSNLDEIGQNLVMNEIKTAAASNKLILLATNNKNESEAADDVINLPIV